MKNSLFKIVLNFTAVLILVALIATPIYFAKNFAKVAGVKSESRYLIVSQIEKFPNLKFAQDNQTLTITYSKSAKSQAFVGILILNNPTSSAKIYALKVVEGKGEVFFGEEPDQKTTRISVPQSASTPISLISSEDDNNGQSTSFVIEAQ